VARAERREFVVVGAGLVGLATAHALGARGRDVVCLEQDEVGSERSGSKGSSRIFRLGYEDPLYVSMAARAEEGWRDLEDAGGERLLVPCSVLNFGTGLDELMQAMGAAGSDPELVSAEEVAAQFPRLAIRGPAVLDPSGGVLRADRALHALRSTMQAELREHVAATSVDDTGGVARVTTSLGVLEAPVVIVCAGAGSRPLLESAGIECHTVATLEQVAYFRSAPGRARGEASDLDLLPVVIERVKGSELAVFGLPSPSHGWYKLGIHHSGPEVDPSSAPLEPDAFFTESLVRAATSVVRGIDPKPQLVERCLYDNTTDEDFVIDRVGRVVVGAGTSGHGFKFGPLLGSLLADLATERPASLPLDRFSVRRAAVAGFRS